jgi:hypothetical protein
MLTNIKWKNSLDIWNSMDLFACYQRSY